MTIAFHKYHGTGNDFIMIDNRDGFFPKNDTSTIKWLCDRRFGIGGDGLILLENDKSADFKMVYYNSDGNESSMCGNGGRCIVAFGKELKLIEDKAEFIAIDGLHSATIKDSIVNLQMKDVSMISKNREHIFLDTGSPHHIKFVDDLRSIDVKSEGAAIRYGNLYGKAGSNVNFVLKEQPDIFSVRTYERGVEDETLSCGTGVVAAAIAAHSVGKTTSESIDVNVEGGKLKVSFSFKDGVYSNVVLSGPAAFVFRGTIEID